MEAVRQPAVAGRFYPGAAGALEREVRGFCEPVAPAPERALTVVGPHAGYVFSGAIAGEVYRRVQVPSRAVVLGPNHTGLGVRRSVWSEGEWELPGGAVHVDATLAARLVAAAGLEPDVMAHLREHSIEVHLPFLRARRPDVSVVPICLGPLSLDDCRVIGTAMGRAIREQDVLLVASTDMSHYISAEAARRKDELAIERVLDLDPEGLYETVRRHDISMCGFIPTTVTLFAANELGAERAELVRYGNSGDASGDYDRVVGYAGFVIS